MNGERHEDVVGEELACTQSLRHDNMVAIDIGTELRDGVQADITLQSRRDPRADALFTGSINPLTTTRHATME